MTNGKDTVCSICHGEIGPDVYGRIMCYGCGPYELLPHERRDLRPPQSVRPAAMNALVYRGAGTYGLEERPRPELKGPGDAIVRILCTSISSTDLHILKGDAPEVAPGRILGHEAVGVIEQVAGGVTGFRRGDHVLVSSITSCGRCAACRRGMTSNCEEGGWALGRHIDGTHAEYVRVPFADYGLHKVPAGVDEDALALLSDVFPTGHECGVLSGAVKPGDVVCVVGAGPVGLAALMTAQLYSPAQVIVVEPDDFRLETARRLGATAGVGAGATAARVLELTNGRGIDVAIEAVGLPETFELCEDVVAPGGHIANVGVHGRPATLRLQKLWSRNVTITTRLVDAVTIPLLLETVRTGRLDPRKLVTHTFRFEQLEVAYRTFANAAANKALKVLIKNG